jgi:hypothetical protein
VQVTRAQGHITSAEEHCISAEEHRTSARHHRASAARHRTSVSRPIRRGGKHAPAAQRHLTRADGHAQIAGDHLQHAPERRPRVEEQIREADAHRAVAALEECGAPVPRRTRTACGKCRRSGSRSFFMSRGSASRRIHDVNSSTHIQDINAQKCRTRTFMCSYDRASKVAHSPHRFVSLALALKPRSALFNS